MGELFGVGGGDAEVEEVLEHVAGDVGPHEGFADEDGVGAGVEDALGVGEGFDAGLGDEEDGLRDFVGE